MPPPPRALKVLTSKLQHLGRLQQVSALVGWDQQVMMPGSDKTAAARADQLAALAVILHEKATCPALGEALVACEIPGAAELLGPRDAAVVRDGRRDFDRLANVSAALAERHAVTSLPSPCVPRALRCNDA